MNEKLRIDPDLVDVCRRSASLISDSIEDVIHDSSTDSVERTVARLMGVDGVDADGVPLPNVLTDHLKEKKALERGMFYWLGNACLELEITPSEAASQTARGEIDLTDLPTHDRNSIMDHCRIYIEEGLGKLSDVREERKALMTKLSAGTEPLLYVIVATGNIYEDTVQARAAALQGADIVAVIRTTAQSLLDYVPYGPTTEGFGGTYATQENFRIMRKALDRAGEECGRYIRLVNYASGLCMPEIAVTGAFERLDMMLNDAIYGILFRDINMERTFVDQYFSRMINAYSGIIINTGEDNYLTTSDAVEEAHTVMASQFINRELAERSGLPENLMGLGHAFEINPDVEDGFLMEIAQAQLVRQLFPESPIKYMPPTKYMSGNIFKGHLMDGLFNMSSILTGQSIQLLGMLTEAIHTPFLQDRALSIENAKHVFNTARHLSDEIMFKPGGRIQKRADKVLKEAADMLKDIAETGLMEALEKARFAGIGRSRTGGKGASGVFRKHKEYQNPYMDAMKKELNIV